MNHWVTSLLAGGATIGVLATYPYAGTGIAYRRSDNGLAYILLVMGVGIWNAMFVAQLLSAQPLVTEFFHSLSFVGALLTALGWLLFAGTASSTPMLPRRRLVYGAAAVLVGLNVVLVLTNPIHELYWTLPADSPTATFAVIVPTLGYWLHTQLLVVILGVGTLLFASAWESGRTPQFSRAYTVAGAGTIAAVIGSNVVLVGGASIAPLAALSLTTVGWIQADHGKLLAACRSYVRSRRSSSP